MTAPLFKVAVRDDKGVVHLFKLQNEEIPCHETARALVLDEVKGASAVLIGLPAKERMLEEQVA